MPGYRPPGSREGGTHEGAGGHTRAGRARTGRGRPRACRRRQRAVTAGTTSRTCTGPPSHRARLVSTSSTPRPRARRSTTCRTGSRRWSGSGRSAPPRRTARSAGLCAGSPPTAACWATTSPTSRTSPTAAVARPPSPAAPGSSAPRPPGSAWSASTPTRARAPLLLTAAAEQRYSAGSTATASTSTICSAWPSEATPRRVLGTSWSPNASRTTSQTVERSSRHFEAT